MDIWIEENTEENYNYLFIFESYLDDNLTFDINGRCLCKFNNKVIDKLYNTKVFIKKFSHKLEQHEIIKYKLMGYL